MAMSAAIFLLQFFDNLSKNIGNFEVKKEGKKSKNLTGIFQAFQKDFPKEFYR